MTAGLDKFEPFAGRVLASLLIAPLSTLGGLIGLAGLGTARPGGFASMEEAALLRIVPALRNAWESRALRRDRQRPLELQLGLPAATSAARPRRRSP